MPPGDVSLQTSSPEIDQQIPPLVTKLKSAGVNNLIMMATHARRDHGDEGDEVAGVVPRDHRHLVPVHRPRHPRSQPSTKKCGHTRSVSSGSCPESPAASPRRAVATFQWFWGTDQGTRWDGCERAPRRSSTPTSSSPGPNLTKQTAAAVADRLRKANAGVGGAYSDSAFTFEAPPPPAEGGIPSAARRWAGGTRTRKGPATTTCRLNGKGRVHVPRRGPSATSPGTFPKAKKKFFDTTNSTSASPRSRRRNPSGRRTPARAARAPATARSHRESGPT